MEGSERKKMSWIYDLPDGRKACIYMEGNRILLRTFSNRSTGTAAVLKEDCRSELFCFMFYGTIYFAYEDTGGGIVFDGIGSGSEIRLQPSGEISGIRLTAAAGSICVFFMTKDPDTGRSRLNVWEPYESGDHRIIREEKRSFQYCTRQLDNTILAVLYRGREILSACIWVEGELRDIVTPEQNERVDRLFEELELERQTAREEKELTERKRQEYEQLLRQYAGEIRYVKQKYDELAEYAEKLQRAVKQWREQYMEEIDI